MDWFALVTLLYVVGFESFGLRKPPAEDDMEAHLASEQSVTFEYKEIRL